MKLSIVMPMYNAADIAKNLKEATKSLEKVTKNYEIILVDDGSKNNCFNEAKKFRHEKVKVVGYKKNQGKGNAIKYGFNFVKGSYVAFVDSGRDINPEQLSSFIKLMDGKKVDIVIGSKRHPGSVVRYPLFRRIMSGFYQLINSILFNLNIKDTQVGMKLFRLKVLKEAMPKVLVKRFAFDLELLVIANKRGYKIIEAPIIMNYKFHSTINLFSVLRILIDTAAIFYRLKIRRSYD